MSAPNKIGFLSLKNVRLSFASGLFEANYGTQNPAPGAKKKFNCGILLLPTDPQIQLVKKGMQDVARDIYKDEATIVYNALAKMDKLALHDGDTKPNYAGYPGNMYLSPATPETVPPTLVVTIDGLNCTRDTYKNDKIEQVNFDRLLRQKFYSGAYVNANIAIWAQKKSHPHGPRLNCQLRGLQFFRDGDAFGGGGSSADAEEFDAMGAEAQAPAGGADGFSDEIG